MVLGHDEIVTAQQRVCYINLNYRVHGDTLISLKTAISLRLDPIQYLNYVLTVENEAVFNCNPLS